jgi:hypothetical protein
MRIRTVKPEFWVHPVMSRLAYDTRILALGLLNLADDEGYFDADPDYIRGAVLFREDSSNVRRMLDELSRSEWIDLCGSPDRPIGRVTNFRKHQRVDRPQPSRLKQYALAESSTNDRRALDDQSTQDQGSGNGTGKGKDTPIVPASGDDAPPAPPVEDPILLRAKAIFRMRPGTPLDRSLARAWKTARAAVAATQDNEWLEIESYYAATLPERDDYRRKDLATLLNNWSTELTRAATHCQRHGLASGNSQKKETEGPPADIWRAALVALYPDAPPEAMPYAQWSDIPESLRREILEVIAAAEESEAA